MGSRDETGGQELGSRLRELREERGLSLRELAARAAIDYTYLSKIETAHSASRPSVRVLGRLAEALGVEAMELIALTDRVPEPFEPIARSEEAMRFFRRAAEEIRDADGWRDMSAALDRLIADRKDQ